MCCSCPTAVLQPAKCPLRRDFDQLPRRQVRPLFSVAAKVSSEKFRFTPGIRCVYIDVDNPRDVGAAGPFEARYLAFLETIANLRPSLHRYCSRMTGSVMDGEDVVQDALFHLAPGIGHWHPHMMVFSPYYENSMLGGNEFGPPIPIVTDDGGTPFAVVVIPVDDKLAVKAQAK